MSVKYFGQFLFDKGVVSREDLLRAVTLQEQKNLRLGELSVTAEYIAELQCQKKLKLGELATAMENLSRMDAKRTRDKEFPIGMTLEDLLIELGLMAQNQLNQVISRNRMNHPDLGEALVLVGALGSEQLARCREEFEVDQAHYTAERIELPEGIADRSTWEMAAGLTRQMIFEVFNLPFSPGQCRTISAADTNFMMAAMDMSGDLEARYIISVSEKLQLAVAKAILEEDCVDGETKELLEDTVLEFLNVVCGNVAAKCSQLGKIVNISPPVALHAGTDGMPVPLGHIGLCFPVELRENERMELILIIKADAPSAQDSTRLQEDAANVSA